MDSTNVSLSYDLESNETYHILVETHSNDGDKEPSHYHQILLQENTCFDNKYYYATYVIMAIISVFGFSLVYIFYL
jgi:hypothetical protein